MKLSARQIEHTTDQISAQAVPEDHPMVAQLIPLFGDHTYFLDKEGLEIVEKTGETAEGRPTALVIKLASWADMNRTTLAPHDPEPTDIKIRLEPESA
ncbi:MAG: hypothetical protein JNL25_07075 [Rhodospirillaceae bacterium]|nr:hypothetical protein [Rhodospirillaceae bacterium]